MDEKPPEVPSKLSWSVGEQGSVGLNAAWNPSTSKDVSEQRFQLFLDAEVGGASVSSSSSSSSLITACVRPIGLEVPLQHNVETKFVGIESGKTYRYKLKSIDGDGNMSESECSKPVVIYEPTLAAVDSNTCVGRREFEHEFRMGDLIDKFGHYSFIEPARICASLPGEQPEDEYCEILTSNDREVTANGIKIKKSVRIPGNDSVGDKPYDLHTYLTTGHHFVQAGENSVRLDNLPPSGLNVFFKGAIPGERYCNSGTESPPCKQNVTMQIEAQRGWVGGCSQISGYKFEIIRNGGVPEVIRNFSETAFNSSGKDEFDWAIPFSVSDVVTMRLTVRSQFYPDVPEAVKEFGPIVNGMYQRLEWKGPPAGQTGILASWDQGALAGPGYKDVEVRLYNDANCTVPNGTWVATNRGDTRHLFSTGGALNPFTFQVRSKDSLDTLFTSECSPTLEFNQPLNISVNSGDSCTYQTALTLEVQDDPSNDDFIRLSQVAIRKIGGSYQSPVNYNLVGGAVLEIPGFTDGVNAVEFKLIYNTGQIVTRSYSHSIDRQVPVKLDLLTDIGAEESICSDQPECKKAVQFNFSSEARGCAALHPAGYRLTYQLGSGSEVNISSGGFTSSNPVSWNVALTKAQLLENELRFHLYARDEGVPAVCPIDWPECHAKKTYGPYSSGRVEKLAWKQGSGSGVKASWDSGVTSGASSLQLILYQGNSCQTELRRENLYATANEYQINSINGDQYYTFKIKNISAVGDQLSECSPAFKVYKPAYFSINGGDACSRSQFVDFVLTDNSNQFSFIEPTEICIRPDAESAFSAAQCKSLSSARSNGLEIPSVSGTGSYRYDLGIRYNNGVEFVYESRTQNVDTTVPPIPSLSLLSQGLICDDSEYTPGSQHCTTAIDLDWSGSAGAGCAGLHPTERFILQYRLAGAPAPVEIYRGNSLDFNDWSVPFSRSESAYLILKVQKRFTDLVSQVEIGPLNGSTEVIAGRQPIIDGDNAGNTKVDGVSTALAIHSSGVICYFDNGQNRLKCVENLNGNNPNMVPRAGLVKTISGIGITPNVGLAIGLPLTASAPRQINYMKFVGDYLYFNDNYSNRVKRVDLSDVIRSNGTIDEAKLSSTTVERIIDYRDHTNTAQYHLINCRKYRIPACKGTGAFGKGSFRARMLFYQFIPGDDPSSTWFKPGTMFASVYLDPNTNSDLPQRATRVFLHIDANDIDNPIISLMYGNGELAREFGSADDGSIDYDYYQSEGPPVFTPVDENFRTSTVTAASRGPTKGQIESLAFFTNESCCGESWGWSNKMILKLYPDNTQKDEVFAFGVGADSSLPTSIDSFPDPEQPGKMLVIFQNRRDFVGSYSLIQGYSFDLDDLETTVRMRPSFNLSGSRVDTSNLGDHHLSLVAKYNSVNSNYSFILGNMSRAVYKKYDFDRIGNNLITNPSGYHYVGKEESISPNSVAKEILLDRPSDVTSDTNGNLYIMNRDSMQILKLAKSGANYVATVIHENPEGSVSWIGGALEYVASIDRLIFQWRSSMPGLGGYGIFEIPKTGGSPVAFSPAPYNGSSSNPPIDGVLASAHLVTDVYNLTLSPNGHIYANILSHSTSANTTMGAQLLKVQLCNGPSRISTCPSPSRAASTVYHVAGKNGNNFTGFTADEILSGRTGMLENPIPNIQIDQFAVDSSENVYFGYGPYIYKFDPNEKGKMRVFFDPAHISPEEDPALAGNQSLGLRLLEVHREGNIEYLYYLGNYYSPIKFDNGSGGKVEQSFLKSVIKRIELGISNPTEELIADFGRVFLNSPSELHIDKDGNIIISETGQNNILRIKK